MKVNKSKMWTTPTAGDFNANSRYAQGGTPLSYQVKLDEPKSKRRKFVLRLRTRDLPLNPLTTYSAGL